MRVYERLFFMLVMTVLILFLYLSYRDLKSVKPDFDNHSQEDVENLFYEVSKLIEFKKSEEKVYKEEPATSKPVTTMAVTEGIKKDENMKYILQWTPVPSVKCKDKGQNVFINAKCKYTNCYITKNRTYLEDYTKFDVIAFSGPQIVQAPISSLPTRRSQHQKFAFISIESSDYYPICRDTFNGFFNWTWTYRLDSDSKWCYVVVKDINGRIIGPKQEMHWMKLIDMSPISAELKMVLRNKTKAAAWVVANCVTKSKRELFVHNLKNELDKFNLELDVYGNCGDKKCSHGNAPKCHILIKRDYYFYLSFENSFSEDYVTEKLLHALQYNAVPVVYGGANYTRFMPKGIYIDAKKLGPRRLARKMHDLIHDQDKYFEYFKWTNHYKFLRRKDTPETNVYCSMCALLNDQEKINEVSSYTNFKQWWNSPYACHSSDNNKPIF